MSKCYFVPLNLLTSRFQEELTPISEISSLENVIKVPFGKSYTVSLESFSIADDEKNDSNDLLVRTKTLSKNLKENSDTQTTVLNYFERNVPAGKTIDNLLSEHIYLVDKPINPFSLEINTVIIEVDNIKIDGEGQVLDVIRNLADFAGALFPSLILPYVGIGNAVLNGLETLIKLTKKNENIFNCELKLDGKTEIPAGAYIFFQDNAENIESKYKLRGLRLEKKLRSTGDDLIDQNIKDDFIIIKVVPGVVCSGGEEDLLQNQQLATILEEFDNSELSDQEVRQKLFVSLKQMLVNFVDKQDLDYIHKVYNHIKFGETLVGLDADHWEAIRNRIGGLFSQLLIDKISEAVIINTNNS